MKTPEPGPQQAGRIDLEAAVLTALERLNETHPKIQAGLQDIAAAGLAIAGELELIRDSIETHAQRTEARHDPHPKDLPEPEPELETSPPSPSPIRASRSWSRWETLELLEGLRKGRSMRDIASALGRNVSGVRRRVQDINSGRVELPEGTSMDDWRIGMRRAPGGNRRWQKWEVEALAKSYANGVSVRSTASWLQRTESSIRTMASAIGVHLNEPNDPQAVADAWERDNRHA